MISVLVMLLNTWFLKDRRALKSRLKLVYVIFFFIFNLINLCYYRTFLTGCVIPAIRAQQMLQLIQTIQSRISFGKLFIMKNNFFYHFHHPQV